MNRVVLILAASVACFAQTAQAEGAGAYLGVGLADGFHSACDDTALNCTNYSSTSQRSIHLRLVGGYNFNKYIGIEGGWADLGTYDSYTSAGTIIGTVKASALTLAAKGGYTFPHGFSIFGKAGLASVNTRYSANPGLVFPGTTNQRSTGVIVGIGGQYDFTEVAGIRVGIDVITYNNQNYNGGFVATNVLGIFKF